MTGYTVHTGTSKKFASGWDRVFAGGSKSKSASKPGAKSVATKGKSKKKS